MISGREAFSYGDITVREHIQECVPNPNDSPLQEPFYVYIMGPYTAFDAEYAFDDAGDLKSKYIEDPLFNPEVHVNSADRATYEAALTDLCELLRTELGVSAFLATDISTIPTIREAENEPGMSVLDQSVAFAAMSEAVIFLFTRAGLTTGTGSEVGAILSDFNLRRENIEPDRKPRKRIGIFPHGEFSSASINEIPYTYDIAPRGFSTRTNLLDRIRKFIVNIQRDQDLSLYNPYRESEPVSFS